VERREREKGYRIGCARWHWRPPVDGVHRSRGDRRGSLLITISRTGFRRVGEKVFHGETAYEPVVEAGRSALKAKSRASARP
jgi:hypothetical protein